MPKKGYKASDEHKAKISASIRGKRDHWETGKAPPQKAVS